MVCSPPGSSVHEISQARIPEWADISFSRESSRPRDRTCISCIGRRILYCWAAWEAHATQNAQWSAQSPILEDACPRQCTPGSWTHVIGCGNPRSHLWKFTSWRFMCGGLTVFRLKGWSVGSLESSAVCDILVSPGVTGAVHVAFGVQWLKGRCRPWSISTFGSQAFGGFFTFGYF